MRADDALRRVRDAGGDELVERLEHLEGHRRTTAVPVAPPPTPRPGDDVDADVVVAGGGLWTLLAPLLAARGLRVVVVERARAGQAHREWNASGPELQALVSCGLLTQSELAASIVARYERGICKFASMPAHPVRGVLDHAVDAGALLGLARSKAERAGVRFLDGRTVTSHAAGASAVRVRTEGTTGEDTITGAVMVDARGISSPAARADLICPTVGGTLAGLDVGRGPLEVDPSTGEILVTIDGVVEGRQYVWEGFPGRPGETTVYLFHYARVSEEVSLTSLYARFFDDLPRYKRGEARLLRPTFGFIPGWSRLTPGPTSEHPRVVLVGDAAARHSPLTYCGFGATLRSLARAADVVEQRVAGAGGAIRAVDDAPLHALTGALAHLLASRRMVGDEVNRLLDAAFSTLEDLGNDDYARLLRDEMSPARFVDFLRTTARRHPAVWGQVMRGLGPWTAGRWGWSVARSVWSGAGAG